MKHLTELKKIEVSSGLNLSSQRKNASGQFFTPEVVGKTMVSKMVKSLQLRSIDQLDLIDPFCGDGRLLTWFLEAWPARDVALNIEAWDVDEELVVETNQRLKKVMRLLGQKGKILTRHVNTFEEATKYFETFDCVITNPPWDVIKPDQRQLSALPSEGKATYIEKLRELDKSLGRIYPEAQPAKKFAGWGTNLSRVGLAAAIRLAKPAGKISIVLPASVVADSSHENLRSWLTQDATITEVASYPAEAKLFDKVDVHFVTLDLERGHDSNTKVNLIRFNAECKVEAENLVNQPKQGGASWSFSIHPGCVPPELLEKLSSLPTLGDLLDSKNYWAGRELDETGLSAKVVPSGIPFLKGRDIRRFDFNGNTSQFIPEELGNKFQSISRPRLAWRDVSRPSQRRRVQATLIPPGFLTGNSLGVLAVADDDPNELAWLLGIFSSAVFESQLRSFLATGHVTLASLKKIHLPTRDVVSVKKIASLTNKLLENYSPELARILELEVCNAYDFSESDKSLLFESYPWIDDQPTLLEL